MSNYASYEVRSSKNGIPSNDPGGPNLLKSPRSDSLTERQAIQRGTASS